jgi:hypothetical protein
MLNVIDSAGGLGARGRGPAAAASLLRLLAGWLHIGEACLGNVIGDVRPRHLGS